MAYNILNVCLRDCLFSLLTFICPMYIEVAEQHSPVKTLFYYKQCMQPFSEILCYTWFRCLSRKFGFCVLSVQKLSG